MDNGALAGARLIAMRETNSTEVYAEVAKYVGDNQPNPATTFTAFYLDESRTQRDPLTAGRHGARLCARRAGQQPGPTDGHLLAVRGPAQLHSWRARGGHRRAGGLAASWWAT